MVCRTPHLRPWQPRCSRMSRKEFQLSVSGGSIRTSTHIHIHIASVAREGGGGGGGGWEREKDLMHYLCLPVNCCS